jgi:tRNA (guanine-N7-)-methyltransferase
MPTVRDAAPFQSPSAATDPLRVVPEDHLSPQDWHRHYPRRQPLHVEVGAGKGRFILARARRHPEVNFLGIERMLVRARRIGGKARRAGLDNLRLLRLDAFYAVTQLFAPASVDVFYIFFPDPWPKARHARHRVCNPPFLAALARALRPGGEVHFATDHLGYFTSVVEGFQADPRWERIPPLWPTPEERSDFELLFIAEHPIGRHSVRRRADPGPPAT